MNRGSLPFASFNRLASEQVQTDTWPFVVKQSFETGNNETTRVCLPRSSGAGGLQRFFSQPQMQSLAPIGHCG